jgi:hypothetical protein
MLANLNVKPALMGLWKKKACPDRASVGEVHRFLSTSDITPRPSLELDGYVVWCNRVRSLWTLY